MRTDFDVIVVGAGGSGLAAAYSAAERDAHVLVLERMPQPGGTTGIAVGSYTAAQTSLQRSAGIEDSIEAHAEDAGKFAPAEIEARNNEALRRYFLSQAATTWEWLSGLGLSFVGPSPEPPNRAPRMHNVVPGAKAYVATLQLALAKRGGTLLCNADVKELRLEAGRVVGVEALVDGDLRHFSATRGVILAGGDYTNNGEMLAKFKGEEFRNIEGINPYAIGGGHCLAESAGAEMVNMDVTYGPELRFTTSSRQPFKQWLPTSGWAARVMGRLASWLPKGLIKRMIKRLLVTWQHPEDALLDDGAILINRAGQRFVDESKWPEREIAVAEQEEKYAYFLLDERLIGRYSEWPHFISTAPDIAYAYVDDYLKLRPDVARKFAKLDELSGFFPPQAVQETVEAYNECVRRGEADAWGRLACTELSMTGPWVLLGPVKAYFTTTEGGAMIDQQLRVLDESSRVIPGLFAVGQNGLGGQILFGHGLHIAWAMTSGRLAGVHIMKDNG